MFVRYALVLALVALLAPAAAQPSTSACLTTLPPNPPFSPPAPYDAVSAADGTFWYGTDSLWTQLAQDGVWHLTDNVEKRGGYVTKLVFWRKGFDWRKEPEPELVVTARRLDRNAPSVAVSQANSVFITGNAPAMMTGIRIPTSGCWEIAGHYRGHNLAFIASVER